MTLGSLLSEGQIVPELKAQGRWEAIAELVDALVANGKIQPADRDSVFEAIRQRELTVSTGIGFGIAIPHASSACVEDVAAAFGRSTPGIDFDAIDGQLAHCIVLFVVPKDQFQTHLRTLAAIAKFLNDPHVREALSKANSTKEILEVFQTRRPKN